MRAHSCETTPSYSQLLAPSSDGREAVGYFPSLPPPPPLRPLGSFLKLGREERKEGDARLLLSGCLSPRVRCDALRDAVAVREE